MASDTRPPHSPGMPLFQLSPERINVPRFPPGALPQSPSLPDFGSPKHFKTNSDVQAMVSRFNSLDIKDHAELRKQESAALKRAQLGREEAECELKKAKDESRRLREQVEEGKTRELKVMKRLDIMMEEVHRSKETQSKAQSMYEKEIRRAKKEAFKSSAALVKLQEELKATRNALRLAQTDIETERTRAAKREQETFDAQYQLVGMQEELAESQSKIKVVQEERDALKTSLKEEEVARIAAEGRIALPSSTDDTDEFASPKKQRTAVPMMTLARHSEWQQTEMEELRAEAAHQRTKYAEAEQQIEFMKMECQYQCCSCRVAELHGDSFIHDNAFDLEIQRIKTAMASVAAPPASDTGEATVIADYIDEPMVDGPPQAAAPVERHDRPSPSIDGRSEPLVPAAPSPQIGDFEQQGLSSPTVLLGIEEPQSTRRHQTRRRPSPPTVRPVTPAEDVPVGAIDDEENYSEQQEETFVPAPIPHDSPSTPHDREYRTITTTTKVPLADVAASPAFHAFASPGLTREEAIELLRQRRGRARSIAGTPKKPIAEKETPRRDISAPERTSRSAPRQASRGTWR